MIRTYDIILAVVWAWLMLTVFFTGGIVGGAVAYGLWVLWAEYYCTWKRTQEHGK